jgi:hypothetical protein
MFYINKAAQSSSKDDFSHCDTDSEDNDSMSSDLLRIWDEETESLEDSLLEDMFDNDSDSLVSNSLNISTVGTSDLHDEEKSESLGSSFAACFLNLNNESNVEDIELDNDGDESESLGFFDLSDEEISLGVDDIITEEKDETFNEFDTRTYYQYSFPHTDISEMEVKDESFHEFEARTSYCHYSFQPSEQQQYY